MTPFPPNGSSNSRQSLDIPFPVNHSASPANPIQPVCTGGLGDSSPNVPLNQAVFFDIRLMQLNMKIVRLSNLTEHEIAPKSNSILLLR